VTGDPMATLAATRDPRAAAAIGAGLAAYNADRFRPSDTAPLDVLVHDSSGEPVGGLLGHTSFGLFFLDLFYLPETVRGRGLGSRILALAESEARRRGCTAAFVTTVTFQAPGFYERHGYRRFGEIACPPDGATRIFLTKPLSVEAKDGEPLRADACKPTVYRLSPSPS
jgi:GNAT superfamily N-acetyltransferase